MNFDKLLDYARIALYVGIAYVGFTLFQAWQTEHTPPVAAPAVVAAAANTNSNIPSVAPPSVTTTESVATSNEVVVAPSVVGKRVSVTTDVMQVELDTLGGDVVESKLLAYPESLGSKSPFLLFNDSQKTRYLAESGLISKRGPETAAGQALYTADQASYTLQPNQNELVVKLNWQKDGINVVKTFTFERGSYEVKVGYELDNQSSELWEGNLYTQLLRTDTPPPSTGGLMNLATYFGAAISTPDKPFEKVTFKQMQKAPLEMQVNDGWVAMIQHYFISAWVPPKTALSRYYTKTSDNGLYTIGMIGQDIKAIPGAKIATQAKLYMGPAIADNLEQTAPGLKLTIDYGWFWFISGIIFWMMQKIYDVIGNWGWSIIGVTIIIKILFYKLSAKSYRSMSMLKKLQPRIEKLRERFPNDKQKLTQATMDLYRTEKVNPMSGCLPILIQIPVFIALYWVLVESVQLRQAPFILWIHDLSQRDPYYVLPVIMGITMFLQQRLNPPPADPTQAKVMMLMPIVFTFMFANFPAGLLLYWCVNNSLSFLQQWYIMRKLNNESNVIPA